MRVRVEEIENLFDINREDGMWEDQASVNGPWRGHARRLSDEDIKSHLLGSIWIGTRPRGSTVANQGSGATCRWIVIDIDDHGIKSDRYGPVESRLEMMKRLLKKATPIIFTSPTGKGLHLYYRLIRETPLTKVRQPLVNLCMRNNVFLAKDGIELHPNGTYFRLPFGKFQHLKQIGNMYYQTTISGLDAFEEVRNNLRKIEPIDPHTLLAEYS